MSKEFSQLKLETSVQTQACQLPVQLPVQLSQQLTEAFGVFLISHIEMVGAVLRLASRGC